MTALENLFNLGFASMPNDASQEFNPFGITAVRRNTVRSDFWQIPVRVEIEFLANISTLIPGDIALTVGGVNALIECSV